MEEKVLRQEVKDGMVFIPGGSTMMGSQGVFDTPYGKKEFPEEKPPVKITVEGFWMDETELTNQQFADFVKETGYVTFAEREAKIEDFPPEAVPFLPKSPFRNGSIRFHPPESFDGDLADPASSISWWKWDPDTNWRHPLGAGSTIMDKGNHPVVCITYEDAMAYAEWAGKRLPTEAEWEFAARGGLEGKTYSWGDEMKPGKQWMANTFHGKFPEKDTGDDGFIGIAPVKSFPANGYGLYDIAGNVWEICSDYYDPAYRSLCGSCAPEEPKTWVSPSTGKSGEGAAARVIKGGSFLCHISYCMRYRPAARHSNEADSPSNHIGFRLVKDL